MAEMISVTLRGHVGNEPYEHWVLIPADGGAEYVVRRAQADSLAEWNPSGGCAISDYRVAGPLEDGKIYFVHHDDDSARTRAAIEAM